MQSAAKVRMPPVVLLHHTDGISCLPHCLRPGPLSCYLERGLRKLLAALYLREWSPGSARASIARTSSQALQSRLAAGLPSLPFATDATGVDLAASRPHQAANVTFVRCCRCRSWPHSVRRK